MSRRGPNDPGPQLARSAEVVTEPATPAQQAGVFLAWQPGPDEGHVRRVSGRARAVASTASMMPW